MTSIMIIKLNYKIFDWLIMCYKKVKLHIKHAYINNKIDYYGNQTVCNKVVPVISSLPVKCDL